MRAQYRVLSRGERKTLTSDADAWVFELTGCEPGLSNLLVAINRADTGKALTLPAGSYLDVLSGAEVAGGTLTLGARSYWFLKRR